MSRSQKRKKKAAPVYSIYGEVTVSNTLHWLICIGLAGILFFSLLQLGSARPETQYLVFAMTCALVPLQALAMGARLSAGRLESHFGVILAFGVLITLLLGAQALVGGDAAVGAGSWLMGLQALLLVYLIAQAAQERAQQVILLVPIPILSGYSVFLALDQFFRGRPVSPGLISLFNPGLYSAGLPEAVHDRAVGVIGMPDAAAVLFTLAAVLCACAGASRRGGIELACFLFLMAIVSGFGAILTLHPIGLFGMPIALALVPLIVRLKPRGMIIYEGLLVVLMAFVYFGLPLLIPVLQGGLEKALIGPQEQARQTIAAGGWELAMESGFAGQGVGEFDDAYESVRPVGFHWEASTPVADVATVLFERGIFGFGLLYGLGALAVLYLGRRLLQMPAMVSLEDSDTSYRRSHRHQQVPSFRRMLLGVCLLALLTLGITSAMFRVSATPALLWLGAVIFALAWLLAHAPRGLLPPIPVIISLSLAAMVGGVGIALPILLFPAAEGRIYRDEAMRRMEAVRDRGAEPGSGIEGQLEAVEGAAWKALDRFPEDAEIWRMLGEIALIRGYRDRRAAHNHGELAVRYLERAVSLDADDARSLNSLGLAYWMTGDLDASGEAFARTVEIAPNWFPGWYQYTQWLNEFGSDREATLAALAHAESLAQSTSDTRRLRQKVFLP